jgi:hypothetical protein
MPAGTILPKTFVVDGATGVVVPELVVAPLSTTSAEPFAFPDRLIAAVAFVQLVADGNVTLTSADRSPGAEGVAVTETLQSTVLSAFWLQEEAVKAVKLMSGLAVWLALAVVTDPDTVSGRCTSNVCARGVPTVSEARPCASTLRTILFVVLLPESIM